MKAYLTYTPTKPARILVVEDETDSAYVIRSLLEYDGYVVEVATDATCGIAAFSDSPHDLIITDLAMPGRSGMDLAREIKKACPGTPVILLTGWQVVMGPEQITECGISRILIKPIKKKALCENVLHLSSFHPGNRTLPKSPKHAPQSRSVSFTASWRRTADG